MTAPWVISAQMRSPVRHGDLQELNHPGDHPWAAEKVHLDELRADFEALAADGDPFAQYVLRTEVGAPSGVATLGPDGVLSALQRPPPASHFDTVDETTMLGTDTEDAIIGDFVHLADGTMYQLRAPGDHTSLGSWAAFSIAGVGTVDGVSPVNGNVTLPTDAVAGTGSKRTLGTGAQQAMPGDATFDDRYPLFDGSNFPDKASLDSLKAHLGITRLFEGQRMWVFGHSLPQAGGRTQLGRVGARMARTLGTLGQMGTDSFAFGEAGTLSAIAQHNGARTVEFTVDGVFHGPTAQMPDLKYIPPANLIDYGSGPLTDEPEDLYYGYNDYGRPGFQLNHVLGTMFDHWVPGSKGLVVMLALINTIAWHPTAGSATACKHNIRTCLRFVKAASASGAKLGIHNVDGTGAFPGSGGGLPVAGIWTQTVYPFMYGGNALQTSSVGAILELAFNGDEIVVCTLQRDEGELGGSMEIVDGSGNVLVPSFATVGGMSAAASGTKYYSRSHRLTGFGSGDHVVRVRKTDVFALPIAVDCWWTPDSAPPQVLWMKEHRYATNPTVWAQYMTALDEVLAEAEFVDYAMSADGDDEWNAATMSYDNIHLNDEGHAHYADVGCRKLATSAVWREGSHRMTSSSL